MTGKEPEARDEAGRRVSDQDAMMAYVFGELIPALDADAEPVEKVDVVELVPPPIPPTRKLRIGEVVHPVFPEADE